MASIHDVAAYVLSRCGEMSTMKLQKLCYYSQAWSLAWDGRPIFPERIEGWANGPVSPDLYARHRGQFSVSEWDGRKDVFTQSERGTVDAVIEGYGALTGRELSALTHTETPWITARHGLGPGERGTQPINLKGTVPKRLEQFANSCPQLDSRPSWRLSLADTATDSPWAWGVFDEACAVKIFKLAVEMEKLAWREIQSQNTGGAKGGLRNEAIPVGDLSQRARDRLVDLKLDDLDELFRFRLGNLECLWGIRLGDPWVFYPLWWDPNHQVCPSVPR